MNDKIGIQTITVGYGKKKIIEELSLYIPEKKITIIIGPNGCGKSTLLKSIGRIIPIQDGRIRLDQEDIHQIKTKDLAKRLAVLPQTPLCPDGLSVEELVMYGRYPYQKGLRRYQKEDEEIVDWALGITGLSDFREHLVDCLSGGQRQRVWIAMSLAQQTDTILLDEPTTYLDMSYQLEVLELLKELNEKYGRTIVIVLHDINLAARFADWIIAMNQGEIIAQGSPVEVITTNNLREIYNIEAHIVHDQKIDSPVCLSYQRLDKREI